MKILMTGATGFLGRNTAWQLVGRGHEVVNLQRQGSERSALDLNPLGKKVASLTLEPQYSNLDEAIRAFAPDVCLCTAAIARVKDDYAGIHEMISANILLPSLIARSLIDIGHGTIVNCGTSWQTSGATADYVPFDYYSGTKQAAEAALQAYVVQGLSAISMRMFDNYGPYDTRNKIIDLLFESASNQKPLAMSPGEQYIDLVYVEDAARALVMAAEHSTTMARATFEIYGVSSGQPYKLRDVANIIGELVGREAPINWGGRPYRDREIMMPYQGLPKISDWEAKTALRDGLAKVWSSKNQLGK